MSLPNPTHYYLASQAGGGVWITHIITYPDWLRNLRAANPELVGRMAALCEELSREAREAFRASNEYRPSGPQRKDPEAKRLWLAVTETQRACEAALVAHPLFAEWCAYIDAHPELKRSDPYVPPSQVERDFWREPTGGNRLSEDGKGWR